MKTEQKVKKLNFKKFDVVKLNNPHLVLGGGRDCAPITPTIKETITK